MKISEVKELLAHKLKGDKGDFTLSEPLLKEALLEVLRRTTPRTHIVYEKSEKYLFKYFRRTHFSFWLRYPHIDLSDEANLDMEEELAMAVVYFLASLFSVTRKEQYFKKAEEIIAIYDTNMNWRKNPRFFNCYLLKLHENGKPIYNPYDDNNSGSGAIPILKQIAIEVGKSEKILVENSAGGEITATSDTPLLKPVINGNTVEIFALGATNKGVITVRSKDETFSSRIEVFSAESDGGIIE